MCIRDSFYTLHKIMAGLLDMHVYAADSQALDVVVALANWVDLWTADKPEEHMQDILRTEYGGMNDVLYNLATVTENDRWAQTGDRFTKKIFFTPLALQMCIRDRRCTTAAATERADLWSRAAVPLVCAARQEESCARQCRSQI